MSLLNPFSFHQLLWPCPLERKILALICLSFQPQASVLAASLFFNKPSGFPPVGWVVTDFGGQQSLTSEEGVTLPRFINKHTWWPSDTIHGGASELKIESPSGMTRYAQCKFELVGFSLRLNTDGWYDCAPGINSQSLWSCRRGSCSPGFNPAWRVYFVSPALTDPCF